MSSANSGYLIQPIVKRVVNDSSSVHDGEPLDVNFQLCSQTGLGQYKESNPASSSTYKIYNTTSCPIPT